MDTILLMIFLLNPASKTWLQVLTWSFNYERSKLINIEDSIGTAADLLDHAFTMFNKMDIPPYKIANCVSMIKSNHANTIIMIDIIGQRT